jgi:hypothetical protein
LLLRGLKNLLLLLKKKTKKGWPAKIKSEEAKKTKNKREN